MKNSFRNHFCCCFSFTIYTFSIEVGFYLVLRFSLKIPRDELNKKNIWNMFVVPRFRVSYGKARILIAFPRTYITCGNYVFPGSRCSTNSPTHIHIRIRWMEIYLPEQKWLRIVWEEGSYAKQTKHLKRTTHCRKWILKWIRKLCDAVSTSAEKMQVFVWVFESILAFELQHQLIRCWAIPRMFRLVDCVC